MVNEQRFAMIIILTNILDSEKGVSNSVKSAVAASLMNMIDMSMIPDDDDALVNLINNSIDNFCKAMEEETGIENYREKLIQSVNAAKGIVDLLNQKIKRIKDGEDILNNICLN